MLARRAGVRFPVRLKGSGTMRAQVSDPDGYRVEFYAR
jgi:hypothetical protein